MSWRLAQSLEQLRDEVDALAPNRSKRSDGTIGDDAHKGRGSDHNPNMSNVVCALDLTHDPANGADMHELATRITTVPCHPALKYVIWNKRIWSVARAAEGWRYYSGSNPHTSHMHVSVGRGPDGRSIGPYDDTSRWLTSEDEDEMTPEDRQWISDQIAELRDLINRRTGDVVAHPYQGDDNPNYHMANAIADIWKIVHALDTDGVKDLIERRTGDVVETPYDSDDNPTYHLSNAVAHMWRTLHEQASR